MSAREAGSGPIERVLLVDDADEVRSEVSEFLESPPLEISVIACADVASAVTVIRGGARFDLALVDLGLPDGNGIDVIHCLRRLRPSVPAVVFTIYGDADTIFEALRAGASGYVLKQTPPARLHAAMLEAASGGAPMSPTIARLVVSSSAHDEVGEAALTEREREVLSLLAKGHIYADVAKTLNIALGTVQGYVKSIYSKLEISSKAEAAAIATRLGLV